MSDVTSRLAIPYMEGTDAAADLDQGSQDQAEHLDGIAVVFEQGIFANRPVSTPGSPGTVARFYYATDAAVLYYDYGTGWAPMLPPDGGLATAKLADKAVTEDKMADGVFVPVGAIFPYGGAAAPTNWLLCDGAAVSQSTYGALYAVLGLTYGDPGGGNFNLPDLRGRAPVGEDGAAGRLSANDSRGESAGAEKHTLAVSEMPSHTHDFWADDFALAAGGVSGHLMGDIVGQGSSERASNPGGGYGNSNAGGGGDHNNMQPYQVVTHIIRAA